MTQSKGSFRPSASIPTERGAAAAAHTPGPWEALPCEGFDGDWLVRTSHPNPADRVIIEIYNASEADARLMAAAPALFKAAVGMVKGEDDLIAELVANGDDPTKYGMPFPLVDALRAAIQSATGEG